MSSLGVGGVDSVEGVSRGCRLTLVSTVSTVSRVCRESVEGVEPGLKLAQASNAISAEVNLVEAMRGAGPYEGSRHDEWPLSRGWIRRLLGTFGTKRDVGPLHGSPYVSAV